MFGGVDDNHDMEGKLRQDQSIIWKSRFRRREPSDISLNSEALPWNGNENPRREHTPGLLCALFPAMVPVHGMPHEIKHSYHFVEVYVGISWIQNFREGRNYINVRLPWLRGSRLDKSD